MDQRARRRYASPPNAEHRTRTVESLAPLGVVVVFATAMAYLEAAVVLYLRTLGNRLEPYQPNPLPPAIDFGYAELLREAATVVMLAMVGWLAGRGLRARFGYFLVAFGVWDIFYYVFLKPLTGWPRTLLDWDVLFLIPLPWWGPVIAPMCIAALMVIYGTLLGQCERTGEGPSPGWNVPACRWRGHRAGTVRLHGGRHPRRARGETSAAGHAARAVQLAAVHRGPVADGRAHPVHRPGDAEAKTASRPVQPDH